MKVLVTGGCGYIGSHTIVDLIAAGYDIVSIDNLSNSFPDVIEDIETITSKQLKNYPIDLCDLEATKKVFEQEGPIEGIIHFAAKKYVNESVEKPLLYYQNNLQSLQNILQCVEIYNIPYFVFSSSCSVYGNISSLPVSEEAPIGSVESPYAVTKLVGEQMIQDFNKTHPFKVSILRYFNPIGGHVSGIIGETAKQESPNLMPKIMNVALGKTNSFGIAGNDYPTRDGTCIRDYIHVSDIAAAHTKALDWLKEQSTPTVNAVFNLGSGEGVSVLEMITAFEQANHIKLPYTFENRRPGDVIAVYADINKAKKELNWSPQHSLEEMMKSAWEWENRKKKDN